MQKEYWQKLNTLYNQIIELPESNHTEFIKNNCSDEVMRRELISLLENEASSTLYFETLSAEVFGQVYDRLPELFPATGKAGNYKILNLIGRGGMGSVYLAKRDDKAYERLV